jgi:transcriptional regulator
VRGGGGSRRRPGSGARQHRLSSRRATPGSSRNSVPPVDGIPRNPISSIRDKMRNIDETIRRRMILLLTEREMGARELSQSLGIREKEVYDHLTHMGRSVSAQGKRLLVHPAKCLLCGYVFEDRKRVSPPSRCPRCKRTHIQRPLYAVRES